MYAPIVLFTYNRVDHTRRVIDSLKKNKEASDSDLHIYSDGPKDNASFEQLKKIERLRDYLETISGFRSVSVYKSDKNNGLSSSIISGVSEVLNRYESIIVLEDDLEVSQYFLSYMNSNLRMYKLNNDIVSIHGYIYPVMNLPEKFFLKGADCWGWGTWKRGWDCFNENGLSSLESIQSQNLSYEFDFYGTYPYTKMLKDQIEGKNNSWAIRWYASAFLQNKLTLYPGKSLVRNIGFDGTGTHCDENELFSYQKLDHVEVSSNTISIKEDILAKKSISDWFIKKYGYKAIIKNLLGSANSRFYSKVFS